MSILVETTTITNVHLFTEYRDEQAGRQAAYAVIDEIWWPEKGHIGNIMCVG
jgi:hypothetical protein